MKHSSSNCINNSTPKSNHLLLPNPVLLHLDSPHLTRKQTRPNTMLSPNPLSLFCALLLCLPLAILFTITTPTSTSSAPTAAANHHSRTYPFSNSIVKPKITKPRLPPPPEDDDLLLQLASRVNPLPKTPKKVAFMFLTTSPLPFAPLWELFFNRSDKNLFNIYVHADPTHRYDTPFSGVFKRRVIHSKPSQRYTPTLSSAARRLLSHALLHDPANSMFALLSPSCIPLHSFNFTYKFLTRSNVSFIEVLRNEVGSYDRWAARGENAMLPEVEFEKFRIGSQFWVLTRKHARIVARDRPIWRKFNQTCVNQDTCYPEEHYFPTLIHIKDPRGTASATLTHVDWSGASGGHPRMYHPSEVGPELISTLRSGRPRYGYEEINGSAFTVTKRNDPFLFARKFSPDSIEALLSIVKESILKD